MDRRALLSVENVLTDQLASNPCILLVPLLAKVRCLTIWALRGLRVKCASRIDTILLLNLANGTTNDLVWLRKASLNAKFVKTSLAPQMLVPDPASLDKVSLARCNVSSFRMVEMSLSP